MTHSIDTPTQSPPTSGATVGATGEPSTTDVAKDEARNVGQTAAQAGSQVASTAADQAKQVTAETKNQAQDLLHQGRSQLQQQAHTQQQRAGQGLSEIAQQLRSMVEGGGQTPSGPAADLVRQAGDKVEQVAGWLQNREPGDVVNEVRAYARRRPGMFLLGAAVAGVVAGRLTGGVVSAHKDSGNGSGSPATPRHAAETAYPAGTGYAADTNYVTEAPTAGYAGGTTGYATTGSAGSVPPPPYGTLPPETSQVPPATSAGWDDPAGTSGEGRL